MNTKIMMAMVAAAGMCVVGCEEKKKEAFKDSAKNAGAALKDMAEKGADAVKDTGSKVGGALKEGYEATKKELEKPRTPPMPEAKPAGETPAAPVTPKVPSAANAGPLELTMKTIDEESASLTQYKGKVVMFVNVASKCGYTPQYEALEALYKKKKDEGFVILGFPANNFRAQEPGTDAEIKAFCTDTYGVTFPMYSKISVTGADQDELYKRLSAQGGGEPKWNFTKYLVDKKGKVVAKFDSKTTPDDPVLVAKIDELLAQ